MLELGRGDGLFVDAGALPLHVESRVVEHVETGDAGVCGGFGPVERGQWREQEGGEQYNGGIMVGLREICLSVFMGRVFISRMIRGSR
jgi:hypothetical protein